jgi:hypothetical protein
MKRCLALALVVAFSLATVPHGRRSVQAQSLGVISGTADGPDGLIEGAPVGEEKKRRRWAAAFILGAATAAAGTVGVAIISTKNDASPSR